jgi:hypothetical protein
MDRYFLTWGDLGSNRPWPGGIERAVLRASVGFALGGTPVDARVSDTLQAASGERYFFECLVAMQQHYPLDGLAAQDAQQLLGDEDIDRVMCLGRDVSGTALAAIVAGRAITVAEAGYRYVLSPWADAGYRTPSGYFPPPR